MRRGKSRVLGPYREPSGSWRIVVIEGGRRTSKKTSSQAEAEAIKKELSKELAKCQPVDLPDVLGRYAQHLAGKGNKPASVSGTIGKLTRALAGVSDLAQLTPRKAATLYDRLSTIAQSDVSRYESFVSMPGPETVKHLDRIVSGLGTAILVAYYDECRRIALEAQR